MYNMKNYCTIKTILYAYQLIELKDIPFIILIKFNLKNYYQIIFEGHDMKFFDTNC